MELAPQEEQEEILTVDRLLHPGGGRLEINRIKNHALHRMFNCCGWLEDTKSEFHKFLFLSYRDWKTA